MSDIRASRGVDQLVRRYLLLRGLGYLPVGVLVPVLALLLVERGLTLSTIGAVLAVQGVVVLTTELPTGGLADAVGRRPVLLAAAGCSAVSLALLAAAGDRVVWLVVAVAVGGLHRALESGPLDAWFVDACVELEAGPRAERALISAGVVVGAALGTGSLLAGGLVAWAPLGADRALTLPVVAALALRAVDLVCIAALMTEPRPSRLRADVAAELRTVPATVRDWLMLVRRSPAVGALLGVAALWGLGSAAWEVLTPVRLAELLGDDQGRAGVWMGPVSAGAWGLLALGAAASRPAIARYGPTATATVVRALHGVAVLALALVVGPVALAVAYLAGFAAFGAANPAHAILLHREASGPVRVTLLSVNSMAALGAGAVGVVALGALADVTSTTVAIGAGGLLLVLAAPLHLVVARQGAPPLPAATSEPLDAAAGSGTVSPTTGTAPRAIPTADGRPG